jgi:hypothetical protein
MIDHLLTLKRFLAQTIAAIAIVVWERHSERLSA